jgi:phosphotransferase system IIB component
MIRLGHRQVRCILAAILPLVWLLAAPAAEAQFKCFPSCSTTDAKFLVIASGPLLVTLSDTTLDIELAVPAGTSSFQVGLFDGDSGGASWDAGGTIPYSYTLYADPLAAGSTATIIEMLPGFPSISSLTMPDNAWIDYTVNTTADALSPSGNYFYRLHIELLDTSVNSLNSFKLRTTGVSTVRLDDQPFSYMASLTSLADILTIYPSFPSLTPTTYDGDFRFFFYVLDPGADLTVWDGDFDHGKYDGTVKDTDDPDTPNAPFLPPWATADAVSEGVAVGLPTTTTGNPADDASPADAIFLRPPSVRYDLFFPDGQTFANDNPSGNQEWEQLRISTDPFDASLMDYSTAIIPGGTYELRATGVDLANLNALRLPDRALCVSDAFEPCTPLFPFLVGDTVFRDLDGDGVQSGPGETGIAGVVVELAGRSGIVIGTATTDADGHYSFNVPAGTFTVRVAASNSDPGGPLDGAIATTPVQATETVVDDNVLTYDFGYRGTGSIGNRLWYDADADGVQDFGEPGLSGTTVELLGGGGAVIATRTTDSNGIYTFANLAAGSYTVRVVASTLPAGGLAPTYDLDGTGTAHTAAVTLAAGQTRTDVDFGYRGTRSLGDRVWKDLDGDGIQDAGEPGINGVTVRLFLGSTEVASTVTAGDGNYSFTNLPETTFTVKIDTATLPAGATQTYDLDGLATPHQATVNLTSNRTDVDFGYKITATCTAGYFTDTFTTASFSNNDGTLSGTGAWIESDVAGTGVSSGNVTVGSPYSGYLFLRDYPDTGTQPSAARQANLSGVGSATLSFSFHVRTAVDPDDAVVVEVSSNGGASYTVLETLSGFSGTYTGSRSYNISAYKASNTRIRFRVTNGYGASDELFKLDWVRIDTTCTPTCTAGYAKDLFDTASFSNNDGTLSWAGAWIESDTAGAGVSSGNVTVGSPYAGYLFLRDYPDTGTQPSAARQVNLSGYASATLSFSFHVRTAVDPDDAVVVEVSNNGGTSYTILETLSGFTGTYTGSRSYNISAYKSSNTRIRFRVTNNYGASDELFKLDWVKIDAACQ